MTTTSENKAGFLVLQAIAETIRDRKQVPSGQFYAGLMGKLSFEQYEKVIQILVNAGLVKKHQLHMLEWIG